MMLLSLAASRMFQSAPVSRTFQSVALSALTREEALSSIRRAAREGEVCSTFEEQLVERVSGPHSATYGEITPRGFSRLATRLQLDRNDHFVDLGSGLGRTVVQAVTEFGVAQSSGVE